MKLFKNPDGTINPVHVFVLFSDFKAYVYKVNIRNEEE